MNTIQIDYEIIHNTYGDCDEAVAELFKEFTNCHSDVIESLQSIYHSNNTEEYQRCLHYNASPFTYVGFPQLTEKFRVLINKTKVSTSLYEIRNEHEKIISCVKKAASLLNEELQRLQKKVANKNKYMIAC